jgi:hypothetical protein
MYFLNFISIAFSSTIDKGFLINPVRMTIPFAQLHYPVFHFNVCIENTILGPTSRVPKSGPLFHLFGDIWINVSSLVPIF